MGRHSRLNPSRRSPQPKDHKPLKGFLSSKRKDSRHQPHRSGYCGESHPRFGPFDSATGHFFAVERSSSFAKAQALDSLQESEKCEDWDFARRDR